MGQEPGSLRYWHPRAAITGHRFVAISQGLDTDESNPTTKLLMHILASVAEFERSLNKERVSAGIKAAQLHRNRLR